MSHKKRQERIDYLSENDPLYDELHHKLLEAGDIASRQLIEIALEKMIYEGLTQQEREYWQKRLSEK